MILTGNTILITGGGTGIGLKLAADFVERGNKVIITGRRMEKLEEAQKSVPDLEIIQGDVGSIQGVKALAETVIQQFPMLNMLINNAGVLKSRNITRPVDDLEELTHETEINFHGPVRMNSVLLDTLKKNKGTIINVSSGLGFVPNPGVPIYCATKAALHSYSITLRQQLEGVVDVVEIAPPLVATALTNINGGMPVDEFVTEVMGELEAGKKLVTVGMSTKIVNMLQSDPEKIHNIMKEKGLKMLRS